MLPAIPNAEVWISRFGLLWLGSDMDIRAVALLRVVGEELGKRRIEALFAGVALLKDRNERVKIVFERF
jgi:hypothetical protein